MRSKEKVVAAKLAELAATSAPVGMRELTEAEMSLVSGAENTHRVNMYAAINAERVRLKM